VVDLLGGRPFDLARRPQKKCEHVKARKNSSSTDIAETEREIAQLIRDLETRVGRLNTLTRRGG
jgi:hypothetical protein